MATMINQTNGIHLNVRAAVGGAYAGRHWIPVPADGVPSDLLPAVKRYLAAREDRPELTTGLDVDAPTWESVRAEVGRQAAAEATRDEEIAAAIAEGLARWRREAAEYLAGGAVFPGLSFHAGVAGSRSAPQAEFDAVKAEKDRRDRDAAATKMAAAATLVEAAIERLAAGEGKLDTPKARWFELDGRHVGWEDLPEELQQRLDTVSRQRIEDEKRRKAEAEARAVAERDAWIGAHGSTRLKKGLATGMIDKLGGAYLDERIAHDLGEGWVNWQTADEPKSNDRLNPEESELDALAEARQKWPTANARLVSVGGRDEKRDTDWAWRPALMVDCPWDLEETAIRYID